MSRRFNYPSNYCELVLDASLCNTEEDEICMAIDIPDEILMDDMEADVLCRDILVSDTGCIHDEETSCLQSTNELLCESMDTSEFTHEDQMDCDCIHSENDFAMVVDTVSSLINAVEHSVGLNDNANPEIIQNQSQISCNQQDQSDNYSNQSELQVGYGTEENPIINFTVQDEGQWLQNDNFHTLTKIVRADIVNSSNRSVDLLEISSAINDAYERFVQQMISEANPEDMISLTFSNPRDDRQLFMNFKTKNFDKSEFLARAEKLAQSSGSFLDGGTLEITIQILKAISGARKRISKLLDPVERARRQRSVVVIKNDDIYCGYYAIALGKFHADKTPEEESQWISLRRRITKLREYAARLFMELKIDALDAMDINKIVEIQNALVNYQIVIVDSKTFLKIFAGPAASKKIFLEYTDNHFNLITTIRGYMQCNDFCVHCWVKLSDDNHICKDACQMCSAFPACPTNNSVLCDTCYRTFNSNICFENHIRLNICASKTKCRNCWITYKSKDKHRCDVYKCDGCKLNYTETPHYCYIRPLSMKNLREEDEKLVFYVFYDIESMQLPASTNNLLHVPNLLISYTICSKCFNMSSLTKSSDNCENCGVLRRIYKGENCVKLFCDYLYQEAAPKARSLDANVTVVAHNQRGYDGHFIIQDFYQRQFAVVPSLIMQGSKLTYIKMENVRFIDSLCLFMQPLSSLCKSFNVTETKKGFFPHLFNTPENQNYIGKIPDISNYDPDNMKPEMKNEVIAWHGELIKNNYLYDFTKEIIDYCDSDVKILMLSVMKFILEFSDITNINPITRKFTLASVALEVYRARLLAPSTLAITPNAGYCSRKQSLTASCWLDYQQHIIGDTYRIRREFKIGPYYADGFIPETKLVFEFYGCLFHGCPECYTDRSMISPVQDGSLNVDQIYEKLLEKRRYYSHRGFQITEIWEHEFSQLKKQHNYIKQRISHRYTIKEAGYIDIRESFFGGRTNNIKFYHTCAQNERIRYLDFTSLYPYVLKKNAFPAGHPKLLEEDFNEDDISEYFGFIKCKVLPPTHMNIPILPYRAHKKLLFPLCRTCVSQNNQTYCSHSDSERMLTNTWTSEELKTAVLFGYRIIKIYQVLQFERNTNLFSEYIKMWLKIKQESSGWPIWCQTATQKAEYLADYADHEDIKLDPSEIQTNPGKRSIAKLMLNSLWGKFAQNSNLTKTSIMRNYADLWSLMNDDTQEVLGVNQATDSVIIVQHRYAEEHTDKAPQSKTNIAVASFVTAYARLELFNLLQKIEEQRSGRVLYFDTDSVVFIEREDDLKIECGDYLGELTDEIGPNKKCDKFIALGPKNYAYEVVCDNNERKAIVKVKGIKLSAKTLDLLTIEKLCEMASDYTKGQNTVLKVNQTNIVSDKFSHKVFTKNFLKTYRAVSNKRWIIGNDTRPFGYKADT